MKSTRFPPSRQAKKLSRRAQSRLRAARLAKRQARPEIIRARMRRYEQAVQSGRLSKRSQKLLKTKQLFSQAPSGAFNQDYFNFLIEVATNIFGADTTLINEWAFSLYQISTAEGDEILIREIVRISRDKYRLRMSGADWTMIDWPEEGMKYWDEFPELWYYHSSI